MSPYHPAPYVSAMLAIERRRSPDRLSCPLTGLVDIHDPMDKAVVMPCMHVYCLQCITSWTMAWRKRACPLCKVREGNHNNLKLADQY